MKSYAIHSCKQQSNETAAMKCRNFQVNNLLNNRIFGQFAKKKKATLGRIKLHKIFKTLSNKTAEKRKQSGSSVQGRSHMRRKRRPISDYNNILQASEPAAPLPLVSIACERGPTLELDCDKCRSTISMPDQHCTRTEIFKDTPDSCRNYELRTEHHSNVKKSSQIRKYAFHGHSNSYA